VVAGELQKFGRQFAARIISSSFSEHEDVVVLDLTGAYAVPVLKSLVRTFTLRRGAKPEIVITDVVEFTTPSTFEGALITFDKFREREPGVLTLSSGATALRVLVDSSSPWKLRAETIDENLPGGKKPTRLGLALDSQVTTARVSITVRQE
jgi:hypothetical protein